MGTTNNSIVKVEDVPQETAEQRSGLFLERSKNSKPFATIENLRKLLEFHGATCRYNVISKRYEVNIPHEDFTTDNSDVASLARIASWMKEVNLPTDHYREYLANIGDKNQYNPVLQWITGTAWDGIDRITPLCKTITAHNEEAKDLFIRRWLITAVCLACGNGMDASAILVLQGNQGVGKTWWFRKLCPIPDLIRTDASVDPRNRDSVSQIISRWIVELGEIGSTFRRADLDALKAFITAQYDTLRRPYGTTDQTYPRRTALAASVNEYIFLHDPTGNRRFLTIQCQSINSYHEIDMQQLWAQIYVEVENGETHHLTEREKQLVDEINAEHIQIDPVEERLMEYYNWDSVLIYSEKTATAIAAEIGLKNISQKETRLIASRLKNMNVKTRLKKGMVMYSLPPHLG